MAWYVLVKGVTSRLDLRALAASLSPIVDDLGFSARVQSAHG